MREKRGGGMRGQARQTDPYFDSLEAMLAPRRNAAVEVLRRYQPLNQSDTNVL